MRTQSILALATCVVAAFALPGGKPTTTTSDCDSTTAPDTTTPATTAPGTTAPATTTADTSAPATTPAGTTTAPAGSPTGGNGGDFLPQCLTLGLSVADCTDLLNIAALNGASVNVGGSPAQPSAGSVDNGEQFLTDCASFGIPVLDCANLLNVAAANGLAVDIDPSLLVSLVAELGIPTGLLGGLQLTGTGLIALPTGVL